MAKAPSKGRGAGTPNKRRTEALERARLNVENARLSPARGGEPTQQLKKLGKDMLEDYMMAFHNQAVVYQPLPPGVSIPGRTPDPDKFKEWGMLVVTTAKALAEFQSPKLRAVVLSAPANDLPPPREVGGNVVALNDPNAIARVYQRLVKSVR